MKYLFILLRIIIFTFLPAFLAYLSSETSLFDILKYQKFLGEQFDIKLAKQISIIMSVTLTSLILVLLYELKNYRLELVKSKNLSLMSDLKTSFLAALANEASNELIKSCKFRVWKEEKGILKLFSILKCKKNNTQYHRKYIIIKVEGLSDSHNMNELYFEIEEEHCQGLIGKCYNEREIKYEEDVSILEKFYDLTRFQSRQTRNTKFVLCFPIFNNKNEIVTIISLDSIYIIKIPNEKEQDIANIISPFAQDISKYYPKLFK